MIGLCLCRRVRVEVPAKPEYINVCNCDLCRKSGAAWGYYSAEELAVGGETRGFNRDDIDDVWLILHFCPTCGTATHYTATPGHPSDRCGVNMRLFAQDALNGIETRYQDGRQVFDEDDEFVVTGIGRIGDGKAF